mgnify:FL=1
MPKPERLGEARPPRCAGALDTGAGLPHQGACLLVNVRPLERAHVSLQPPYYSPETDFVSLDLLRSQLLLLRTLANFTIHHWATHLSTSPPSTFGDPPLLDDPLAKQLITLSTFFLKQHALHDDPTSSRSSSPSIVILSQLALRAASSDSPNRGETTDLSTRSAVVQEIFRLAGRIIYFVSAANWSVVFARIKSRIMHYANSDDLLDLSEARILGWCCLDRRRLSAVLQGACFFPLISHILIYMIIRTRPDTSPPRQNSATRSSTSSAPLKPPSPSSSAAPSGPGSNPRTESSACSRLLDEGSKVARRCCSTLSSRSARAASERRSRGPS